MTCRPGPFSPKLTALLRSSLIALAGYCSIVLGADWFAKTHFGITIDGDWFLLLMASGREELRAFAAEYGRPIALAGAATAAVFAVAAYAVWRRPYWAALVALAGALYLLLGGTARVSAFKPAYFAWDTVLRFGEYRHLASVVSAERKSVRPPLRKSGRNRLVIIGESLTSRRMGVYGYLKNTTPQLARLAAEGRLIVRPERRAASQYTARALMNMLLDDRHTQTWRDRADGFRTVLVSAQDRWERYCGIEQLLFDACDERVYIRRAGKPVYDEEIIPAVRKAMAGPKPWVIYVHLMGSHFNPEDRVPESFSCPEDFDAYDRTVLYTDHVLARLVEEAPAGCDIRFTSDHGESVSSGRWRDIADEALWYVPEIVSPSCDSGSRRVKDCERQQGKIDE